MLGLATYGVEEAAEAVRDLCFACCGFLITRWAVRQAQRRASRSAPMNRVSERDATAAYRNLERKLLVGSVT